MNVRAFLLAVIAGGAIAAPLVVPATAKAVTVDKYDRVYYSFCTAQNAVATLNYTNQYGNSQQETVAFPTGCRHYDFFESHDYDSVYANIVNEDGGPVSCRILVNGLTVAASNDNNDYYSAASCY